MTDYGLIPQPQMITPAAGVFEINPDTRVQAPIPATAAAQLLASWLETAANLSFPVDILMKNPLPIKNKIRFLLVDPDQDYGEEQYKLEITPDGIQIQAAKLAGFFHGAQTLRQFFLSQPEKATADEPWRWQIPALTITDGPRFPWRGLHLDVGRHMYTVPEIKKFLELLALHKFNVFHWHLTEDQGWRIEIKKHPRLTEVGAWRAATPIPANRHQPDGKPYGGFYTQEDVREVVAYAHSLGITVVPEIEMPGHSVAVLAAYPHLGCVGTDYEVRTTWGIADDVFCAGNDAVFTLLEDVLEEVFELFPSEYIHIGGDECPKVRWKVCPKCQGRMRKEGLADEHALQSYFIQRMEKFINSRGRKLIGWDEILEGGLAPNAAVMSWRGTEGGIEAAAAGHYVVMTPTSHCYFDYYQSQDKDSEPPAIGGYLPLEKVYAFEPTEGIPDDKVQYVLGGQGNIWTEYIPTFAQVEYMAYPRGAAMAECLWSDPAHRDYANFIDRLKIHLKRLAQLDVNYRDPFA